MGTFILESFPESGLTKVAWLKLRQMKKLRKLKKSMKNTSSSSSSNKSQMIFLINNYDHIVRTYDETTFNNNMNVFASVPPSTSTTSRAVQ